MNKQRAYGSQRYKEANKKRRKPREHREYLLLVSEKVKMNSEIKQKSKKRIERMLCLRNQGRK